MEEARSAKREGEKGMIIILMAIAIVGLIGAGSLAIDIGSALVTKAELQNVADAASLASTRELAVLYKEKFAANSSFAYKNYTLSSTEKARIQGKGITFAAANKAGGMNIVVGNADVDMAKYDDTGNLTYTDTGVKAVQVTSRRDDTQNGDVQTQLARVLGINQIAITAESTAALSALGTLKAGKGDFPIGIDEMWFDSHDCSSSDKVQFNPTAPSSCAGWHTFTTKPASASRLKTIIEGIQAGTFQSPETIANATYYEFTGGVTSAITTLNTMWTAKNVSGHYHTTIPVYKSSGCGNPNQSILIVGFARIDINEVSGPPDNIVRGDVECGMVEPDTGSGGAGSSSDFGTLVSTPGVIQ